PSGDIQRGAELNLLPNPGPEPTPLDQEKLIRANWRRGRMWWILPTIGTNSAPVLTLSCCKPAPPPVCTSPPEGKLSRRRQSGPRWGPSGSRQVGRPITQLTL